MPPSSLRRFALQLAIAGAFSIAFWWYLVRAPMLDVLAPVVELAMQLVWPDWGLRLQTQDTTWRVDTLLPILDTPFKSPFVSLDATRFTLVFPLFWALVLATPGADRLRQLLWGSTVVLMPLVVLMILLSFQFHIMVIINHRAMLTVQPPPFYVLALPYSDWQSHLIGVGRQLTFLVMPSLAPPVVWAAFNARFLRALVLEGTLSRLIRQAPDERKGNA